MSKVDLFFKISVDVCKELAMELGEYIAQDILCELYNGDDCLDVCFIGCDVMKD